MATTRVRSIMRLTFFVAWRQSVSTCSLPLASIFWKKATGLMTRRSTRAAVKGNANAATPCTNAADSTPTGAAPEAIHAPAARCVPPRIAREALRRCAARRRASSSARASSASGDMSRSTVGPSISWCFIDSRGVGSGAGAGAAAASGLELVFGLVEKRRWGSRRRRGFRA
uniref:Uncharacterized protein n=1 Tax=Triticum urartu TaxID=4572 RepID=A0A8R7UU55_TRIUA